MAGFPAAGNRMRIVRRFIVALCFVLLPVSVLAADLGVPKLSGGEVPPSLSSPKRLLTSGGLKFHIEAVSIEPELGLGYGTWQWDAPASDREEWIHRVHAQAGGKISLGEGVYLSAAAKLPLYTYEHSPPPVAGGAFGQSAVSRHEYDFLHPSGSTLAWTGEFGFQLGRSVDLNLYYDQTLLNGVQGSDPSGRPAERVGTRLILRFR